MRVISQGSIYTICGDELETHEKLPAQVYNVAFSKQSGFRLERANDIEVKEDKIYGVHNAKCGKVLDAFHSFERNLGVILSGDKGIGKSLFAKLLSIRSVEIGYPVLIVDKYIPGIASFIGSIEQECVVMFDEFDKTFGDVRPEDGMPAPQTELLSLFDGMIMGKKLFVITCNEINKLNEFLINRPGRFHYHFRFEYPSPEEVEEYLKDKLPESRWSEIGSVVAFSCRTKINYDCLRAIAFELARGEEFKTAIKDLNILNLDEEKCMIVLRYENGMCATSREWHMNLFSNETERVWLRDERGYSYVAVTFTPCDALWSNDLLSNVITPDKFRLEYETDDEDEKALADAAKQSKPISLSIRRVVNRVHYAV
jgi:hypothetical protein